MNKRFKCDLMYGRMCNIEPSFDSICKVPITKVTIEDIDVDCYVHRLPNTKYGERLILCHEGYSDYHIQCCTRSETLDSTDVGYHKITCEELAVLLYLDMDDDEYRMVCSSICVDLHIPSSMYDDYVGYFIYKIADYIHESEYESLQDLYDTALHNLLYK